VHQRVAGLLEEHADDLRPLEDAKSAADLEGVDDVAEVAHLSQARIGVALAQPLERLARFVGATEVLPLSAQLS